MAEATEERGDHVFVAEEVQPVVVVQVGRENGRAPTISFLHELEEYVALLGAEAEVPHLVDTEQGDASQAVDELAGGAIGQRGVELVEEILGFDEQGPVAVLEGLEQEVAKPD